MIEMKDKWVDKYKPRKFEDIVGNQTTIERIKGDLNNIPDLLFYGPPGIGKTATAEVVIRALDADFIELNASDERGIETIRTRIKNFTKTKSLLDKIKIVFLDEVDNLTKDAQDALKRIMELNSKTCRFILTANNRQKIIGPIISRCGDGFEFFPINRVDVWKRITRILNSEAVTITDEAFDELCNRFNGDLRRIINNLQTLAVFKNIELKHVKDIKENTNYINIFRFIQENKFSSAAGIIRKEDVSLLYDAIQSMDISSDKKGNIAIAFAEYDYRRQFAVTEYLQLNALVAETVKILNTKDNQVSSPKAEINNSEGLCQSALVLRRIVGEKNQIK